MAAESPIAKLAAKPLKFQVGVLVGALIVILGVYYQSFYSSLDEELTEASDQYTRLEKEQVKAKKREVKWKQMVDDKKDLDRALSSNQVSLPATSSLNSFLEHLQQQGAVAGIVYGKLDRKKEIPVVGYVKVPLSIEVDGSFHQILKYFYLLSKTKRIITIENFSITPIKDADGAQILRAAFQATTFRQEDGAQPVPKPEASSGIVDKVKGAKEKREGQVEAAAGGKTDEQGNPVSKKSGVNRLKKSGAK